ncbi:MAG: hypothetical protein WAX89_02300 [Alphaproteobacteria bacterium]
MRYVLLALLLLVPYLGHANPFLGQRALNHAVQAEQTQAPQVAEKPSTAPAFITQLRSYGLQLSKYLHRALPKGVRALHKGEDMAAMLLALTLAFAYGAFHVLGPGHGKTIVMSYFLTRKATWPEAFKMGMDVAIAHVGSALLLVLSFNLVVGSVFDAETKTILMERICYGAIVVIGLIMLVRAWLNHAPSSSPWVRRAVGYIAGVIPCTGSMLILLFASANNMLLSGIILLCALALGMAITLTLLAMLAMGGRHLLLNRTETQGHTALLRTIHLVTTALFTAVASLLLLASF